MLFRSFLRLEAGWERSARLKAFGVGATSGAIPPRDEWSASPFFERRPASAIREPANPRRFGIAAIAASVLLVTGIGIYLRDSISGDGYTTPVGGVASIPLHDGSKITLNTESKIRVALTKDERRIELESGEAFFDVAKDATRPFIVAAGDRRIIAIGTRFSVRRDDDDVQVVVTDGNVRIEQRDGSKSADLPAGAVAHATRDSVLVQKRTLHEAEEFLSWRSGYLTFDETSLADAVAEFNRYTLRKIRIEDPKLSALRINGKFRSSNSEDFIQLLRTGFDIRAHQTGDTIYLTKN